MIRFFRAGSLGSQVLLVLEELNGSSPVQFTVLLVRKIPAVVVPVTPVPSRYTAVPQLTRELVLQTGRGSTADLVGSITAVIIPITTELGTELTVGTFK